MTRASRIIPRHGGPGPRPPSESEILAEILLALGSRPDVRVWRANSGAAMTPGGRRITFGMRGQADLGGILTVCGPTGAAIGASLWIECKSATGRLRPEQQLFADMVLARGGAYVVARSVAEAQAGVDAARARIAAAMAGGAGTADDG